ncbi:MAG: glutathione-dependent reductase [Sandaracinus sp.]|nr:glutathione-dependent reductase [Sandaracinus sp.]|tara:strand:+ start:1802 stop:2767 length:966 start_codon:yes stop_codon:yes gene_type:complete
MGGFLRDGAWITEDEWEKGEGGEFQRQDTKFRDWIEDAPEARFRPEAGRYHLYVSYACPWAHRTLISRALLGLEDVVSVSVVDAFMGDQGWTFGAEEDPDATPDHLYGVSKLYEIYQKADPQVSGRVTVPVLWDKELKTIVNNESREIIRMFSTVMAPLGHGERDLAPEPMREAIDAAMTRFYQPLNNGVYRCGFAGTQSAYEEAFGQLFAELDHWEKVLGEHRYVAGDQLTEADIAMFTTLVRFDPVYYVHFKCNGRLVRQYPNLSGLLRDVYQTPGVRETVVMSHIKQHYYRSHPKLNPRRFVPLGPDLSWYDEPHARG